MSVQIQGDTRFTWVYDAEIKTLNKRIQTHNKNRDLSLKLFLALFYLPSV